MTRLIDYHSEPVALDQLAEVIALIELTDSGQTAITRTERKDQPNRLDRSADALAWFSSPECL